MILVDANLLLYAYDASSPHHQAARTWWEETLSGTRPVRLAWITVLAFVRIATHHRVFHEPMTVDEAVGHVARWWGQPGVAILEPGERHWEVLSRLLSEAQAAGNLVTDAHLAALAIEYGATLCSTDQDFRRFEGLAWENPLG